MSNRVPPAARQKAKWPRADAEMHGTADDGGRMVVMAPSCAPDHPLGRRRGS